MIESCKCIFGEKYIKIWGNDYLSSLSRVPAGIGMGEMEQFPLYKHSPRLIKRISDKKVKIEAEPSTGNYGRRGLVQMILSPLCMVLVTVLVGVLLRRGIFILMSASFTGMTAIFSVVKYFQDKKENKEKEAKKKEIYGNYLLEKRKEIYQCWQAENETYRYNYPQADEISRMVENYSSRIYERSSMDEDFLTFAVGHYMVTAIFTIEDRTSGISLESSEFTDDIRSMERQFGVIDKPQVVDLKKANLGLVGERSVIHEQLKYYVSQLSFVQSYHDVQFIVLYIMEYFTGDTWQDLGFCIIYTSLQQANLPENIGTVLLLENSGQGGAHQSGSARDSGGTEGCPDPVGCDGLSILDLDVVLGMMDLPEEQLQVEYTVNLGKEGNIVCIASSGYGKSVFLENVILGLAAKNCVANLNFYTLDFGNNALITLAKLPHMADYIMLDEEEKFTKFRALMTEKIKQRKKLLASALAQNFVVYNEMAETPLKAIVICLDNYDAVKEMGYEMENYFTRLSRDGVGLGIYLIAAASRMSALRAATLNNFKNKIAGVNFDENEIKGLVGRSKYTLPDIQGRALVKTGEDVNVMQLYTPVELKSEVDYSRNLQAFTEKKVSTWQPWRSWNTLQIS